MFDSGHTLFTKHVESDAEYDSCCSMAYRIRQGRDFVTPPTGLSYTGS
jgi:hypothetical protein